MSSPARLPALDLRDATRADVVKGLWAALAIVVLAVPQGIAYAVIAGLPPATGLYAAAVPTIVGALLLRARHVVVGPTNAVSLLVGAAVAGLSGDPVAVAAQLALLVGLLQLAAGVLRLGALVDYVSGAVLYGYITGAATLIALGQLPHVTHTPRPSGPAPDRLVAWLGDLGQTHMGTAALALATVVAILLIRRFGPKLPATLLVMVGGIALSWGLDLQAQGFRVVSDLAPVPLGLPMPSLPSLTGLLALAPVALAITVLSLVESSSVARSLAVRTGERVDANTDFAGLGAANLASAVFGGYPVSGSLGRSTLDARSGSPTRLGALLSGVLVLIVLLVVGPIVDLTPVAVLAGVLLVIAADLIDGSRIGAILRSDLGDRIAFGATLAGTWLLPLDQAIYLGVGISLVLFLRRARLLTVRELVVGPDDRLREAAVDDEEAGRTCDTITILHVEGTLFFGAAQELRDAVEDVAADRAVRVIILRLKRTMGLDYTTAAAITDLARALKARGQHVLLVGMRPQEEGILRRVGFVDELGDRAFFPTQARWFAAMDDAIRRGLEIAGPDAHVEDCPLTTYLERRQTPRTPHG